jgi:DNA-directed RNA polymerase specialized sigma24 family protein
MELRATALWMSGVGPEAEGRVEFTILLERAISGDVSAFEQIILRYERRVFSLAWRLLGRPEDAQDASQDVFLRAFRYLHRFDRRRPFEPWLMKMTVNVCHDLSRKRHAQPQDVINPEVLRAADAVTPTEVPPEPSEPAKPLVVKLLTDDPNIVIYWLIDNTGGAL